MPVKTLKYNAIKFALLTPEDQYLIANASRLLHVTGQQITFKGGIDKETDPATYHFKWGREDISVKLGSLVIRIADDVILVVEPKVSHGGAHTSYVYRR